MPTARKTPKQVLDDLLRPPQIYGVAALILIGVASFMLVVSFLDRTQRAPAQAASAALAVDPFAGISILADAAFVYDMATGKVLYEKNADTQLPLASLTKIMLALTVAESLSIDASITIPYDTSPAGSVQRLAAGERWRVGDVINFTLIASSNNGAEILASAADAAIRARFADAPAEGATIWRMNTLAAEIGMRQSYFLNASGLDSSATQSGAYGSARDMARLLAYAASSSAHVFSATAANGVLLFSDAGGQTAAINTNEALGDIPGLIMGKTGYTDLAGGNLAVVYDIGLAHPVVAVVLGSTREGRFDDMRLLVPLSRQAISQ